MTEVIKARPRYSELRLWLESRYDALATGRNDWIAMAKMLNEAGMRDTWGRKLNARAVAVAWRRVKADRQSPKLPARVPVRASAPPAEPAEPFEIRPINPKETP